MKAERRKLQQFRLPPQIVRKLAMYSAAYGVTKTDLVEEALREHMARGVVTALHRRIVKMRKLLDKLERQI